MALICPKMNFHHPMKHFPFIKRVGVAGSLWLIATTVIDGINKLSQNSKWSQLRPRDMRRPEFSRPIWPGSEFQGTSLEWASPAAQLQILL